MTTVEPHWPWILGSLLELRSVGSNVLVLSLIYVYLYMHVSMFVCIRVDALCVCVCVCVFVHVWKQEVDCQMSFSVIPSYFLKSSLSLESRPHCCS